MFQRQLEENCPQIIGHDAEIWMQLIKRDIPNWENKRYQPNDPNKWWKVYRKLKREADEDMEKGAQQLKQTLDGIKNEREQRLATVVTNRKDLPRGPGPSIRQKINYGYVSGKTGNKGGSKLSLMDKIKKEARDKHNIKKLVPTHELKKQATTVNQAPKEFLEDYKRSATQAAVRPAVAAPRASRPPLVVQRPATAGPEQSFQIREARLKALKEGKPLPKSVSALTYDGPSSPTSSNKTMDQSVPSRSGSFPRVDQSVANQGSLSTKFLEEEEGGEDEAAPAPIRHEVSKNLGAPRSESPARVSSPRPITKRKEPPSIFMSSKKQKVAR